MNKTFFSFLVILLLTGSYSPETESRSASFQGFLDVADCGSIGGWAADTAVPNRSVNVKIFDGTTLLTTILANISRPDVGAALNDNGLHGFLLQLPSTLRNNQPHSIRVTIENGPELTNSPRVITCAPLGLLPIGPSNQISRFEIRSASSLTAIPDDTTTNPFIGIIAEFDYDPKFYRLGEVRNTDQPEVELRSLPWKVYTPGMRLTLRLDTTRPYGKRSVFMQVNNTTTEIAVSRPRGDSVTLAPSATKTFTLTGTALAEFVQRAKSLGYGSTLVGPTIVGSNPCPGSLHADYSQLLAPGPGQSPDFTESWRAQIFLRTDNKRFLNPFWTVKDIVIGDIFAPASSRDITMHGPNSGRVDDLQRSIDYKRAFQYTRGLFSSSPSVSLSCFAGPDEPPAVVSITLEGPSDKTALEAFPPTNPF